MKTLKNRLVLTIMILTIFACSSSDDGDDGADMDCQTCIFELEGENATAEFCDNGDGTITVTADGEETTESLEGISFAEFIAAFELIGATCN